MTIASDTVSRPYRRFARTRTLSVEERRLLGITHQNSTWWIRLSFSGFSMLTPFGTL